MTAGASDILGDFHPVVREWFNRTFGSPTPPQTLGWPVISAGKNTLILAPTGSGKTLAAFLWAINHLLEQKLAEELSPGVRILYVSPLKALNNDIERNLESPLREIAAEAKRQGHSLPPITTAVRTGDTPQSRRAAMIRRPPDILITTPESLYLLLSTSKARRMLETVQYCIVDEIHSLCSNKRGVHLSLSMERLQRIAAGEIVRIGLSATLRPLDRIAAFLGGQETLDARPVSIVDAGSRREMNVSVECPVADFSVLPQEGVWPLIFTEVLDAIRRHRTTLIFVNNRRLAERVAAQLNMLAGEPGSPEAVGLHAVPQPTVRRDVDGGARESPLVQAYHGSMSRAARETMETDLKAGRIRALVATSSLELGIDIGSIDLVIQLQSPKGVARGLQRVGRSGHAVSATSSGRIIPTFREDLVESAVVARGMVDQTVEETRVPENCLDVLAQQVVAMVGVEDWAVPDLYRLVRQSYCYRHLPESLFSGVLQMLAGRYTRDQAFRELRPRISWDKVNGILRALPGSSRLAIMGGGTITDRGLFGVYLADGSTRVGEVDEEFVFETRVGDTFLLGSSVWRVVDMDPNRVLVEPAPGQPARMPFWRGEGIGRSLELGRILGEFRREIAGRLDRPDTLAWLESAYPIDSRSAWNILEYFRRQRDICGVVPHDRLLLVEGFRDEIGDPRIVVHSPFGRRVNPLLGMVLSRRMRDRLGVEPQVFTNDDGVLLRCADVEALPLDLLEGVTADAARGIVLEDILLSPIFGGQFRQNAVRALLMSRPAPGKRTPLWLQRLRAKDLLDIARQYDDFPLVIETMREVLTDLLDLDGFLRVVSDIQAGAIGIATAQTEVPSPFAASLLFDFMAVYIYEWDQPRADTLSRFASVNRELLSEILDTETMSSIIRPEAIDIVERQLQHLADGYRARSPEELMELLLRLGDMTTDEVAARCEGDAAGMLSVLERDGRAALVRVGGEDRWVAGEESGLYAGLHDEPAIRSVVSRYLQHRGPVSSRDIGTRYGLPGERVERLAARLLQEGGVVQGRFRERTDAGTEGPDLCYKPNLQRIHRQTLTVLRREITPCTPPEFARFLSSWQGAGTTASSTADRSLLPVLEQLQGLALPVDVWLRDVLPARCGAVPQESMDRLTASGQIVWVGGGSGRMMPLVRGRGRIFLPDRTEAEVLGPARHVRRYLETHGASFFADLRTGLSLPLASLNAGISELFWNGTITNDVFAELLKVKRPVKGAPDLPEERLTFVGPRRGVEAGRMLHAVRRAIRAVPGWTGRWSIVTSPGVLGGSLTPEERAREQALQLLERYGIVSKEFHRRENLLPWPVIAGVLQLMEMRGEIRRGYFVEGLSGMQFALPAAVDELRRVRGGENTGEFSFLNACDPAQPYGPGFPSPGDVSLERLTRAASTTVLIADGRPTVVIEGHGSRVWTAPGSGERTIRETARYLTGLLRLPDVQRPVREVSIELWNGSRAAVSDAAAILRQERFRTGRDQSMVFDGY